jgi:bifunctional non-homologous end joining protein LigD
MLLTVGGRDLTGAPYSERRAELEALNLTGPYWQTPETFDNGEALFEVVCERGFEGIVAKRADSRYWPGERGWTKIKNRDYWRYQLEREGAFKQNRPR